MSANKITKLGDHGNVSATSAGELADENVPVRNCGFA
jgi:hypothetical protein